MQILEAALFPALVTLVGIAWLLSHVRAWKAVRESERDAEEREFQRRRYRRRLQTSSLVVLLGIATFLGQLIPRKEHPNIFVYFWFGVVLLVLWVLGLALWDFVATRGRVLQMRQDQRIESARLEAEIRRAKQQLREEAERNQANGEAGR